MADYIRRLVSGNKARFKDEKLNLELDLVYVTDQVIIMGYPASGIEGLYRNRREDAIRFLEHRHGKNFWVYNFCPIKENSYEADVFEGRVSRYPFPDHHAPPLAIMPLVAREMHAWLSGSPERVAVLHCKAGKGRSGTMACTYLLSLDNSPSPPKLERSHTAKQWAAKRMEKTVNILPPDEEEQPAASAAPTSPRSPSHQPNAVPSDTAGILDHEGGSPPLPTTANPERSFTDALKGVLDLHTARRMKPPEKQDGKVKQGVSIPSQRRFLYYWALLLAHEAPKHMWAVNAPKVNKEINSSSPPPFERSQAPSPKVRLTQLKLRMHETSGMKMNIVKVANKIIERTSMAKGPMSDELKAKKEAEKAKASASQVWASLARWKYGQKKEWIRASCERRIYGGGSAKYIFKDGKWDKGKMVRSFARLGARSGAQSQQETIVDEEKKEKKIHVFTLQTISDKRWEGLKHDLNKNLKEESIADRKETLQAIDTSATAAGVPRSEANSMDDLTTEALALESDSLENGVLLDAGREVRVKLYMGQVFMGWFWFIPTFHMPQPPPSSSSESSPSPTSTRTTLHLRRKEIDFPVGLGSAIIDVEVDMEWVVPSPSGTTSVAAEIAEPPVRARTEDSKIGTESEPVQTGLLAAAVQAAVGGGSEEVAAGMRGAVETQQGATE
ncbi:hypothetical protein D9613_008608 [Agrocybe pediades]|uniref:phosphatidylinositol-3,4,5-trisphosphate 3-phosphatase n=1 Tax=Agrocybe pediades TaxID=84607 RepID=A0A8H4VNP8_9AGAR|nr:hypothetical protein D9613_008608 [Agrocybe pediades]